jgi:hypothetical protein
MDDIQTVANVQTNSPTVGDSTTLNEVTTMADTTFVPTQTDAFGGMGMGGLLLGTLLARGGLLGGGAVAAEGAMQNNDVLHTLNMQALNNAAQSLGADIASTNLNISNSTAGINQNIAQGQAGINQNIANSALQNVISNLTGFSNLQGNISGAAADVTASVNNSRQAISDDIRSALGVIDADMHSIDANLSGAINGVRNDVRSAHDTLLAATHNAEVNQLKGNYDILKSITDDGDKTRSLITTTTIADLERQLTEQRHGRSTDALTINNNNNANALSTSVSTALQAQQQQQQMLNLSTGLASLMGHVNNLTQSSVVVGRGNTVTPTATNVSA